MELLAAITQDCIEICRASYYECELGKDPIQHLNVLENGRLEYTPKKTGILNLSRKSRETEVLKAVDAVRQRWEACSKSEQKQIHSDVAAHLSARDGMTFNRIISPGTLISRITFCSNFRFSNTEHQRDALIARASALHQVCKDVVGVEKAAIRELEQLDLWPLESLHTVSPKALEARIERLKRRLSCLLAQPQHAQKMVAIPFKFEYADILKTAWMDYLSAHQGIPLFQLRFGPGGSSPQSSSSPCSLYALWQCMAKLPILKELDLNGMPINDGVFRTLEQLLAKHQLRSLRIAQLDPDEIDVCELCDLLTEQKSLEVLVLDLSKFNLSTSSEEALLSILGQQAKLTWLDLRGLRLREAGYDQALTIMKQAKELEALILDCHGLDCALTDRILLEAIQLPQLRTLDLGKAQLSETAVAQALELLQKRTFPLSVNATTPEMCSDLREAINTWAREQKNSPIPRTIQCAAS